MTRKVRNEIELKKILEILRFGSIIVEMCTGIEIDDLVPSSDTLNQVEQYQKLNNNSSELLAFINFIFFNNYEDVAKSKIKYVIPELEDLIQHNFFNDIQLSEEGSLFLNNQIDPAHFEVMQYLNGSLKLKNKKQKKFIADKNDYYSFPSTSGIVYSSTSLVPTKNVIQNSNDDPKNHSTSTELSSNISMTRDEQKKIYSPLPPPPPPPPLPQSNFPLISVPISTSNRTALLGSIRIGAKLKKTVTNDISKPNI